MKTSPRAGFSWRSLLRRAPWLVSAVLLGLVGCARSERVPVPVEASVEGYWVRPFSRASRLVPCGHGNHVWAWTPQRAGLGLVDADGGELSVKLGDESARVVDVIPSADPERAWVHVEVVSPEAGRANAVYSVDHRGSLQRIDALPSQELVLAPSEGHERLWAVSLFTAKTLWVIDTAGGVEAVALSIPGQVSAAVGRATLVPVGDGRQGWLVLDQNLHQVDLQAKSKFNPRPLSTRDVRDLIPTSRAQRVWVVDPSGQTAPRLLQMGLEGAAGKSVVSPPPLPDTLRRPFAHQGGDSLWLVAPSAQAAKAPGTSATPLPMFSLKMVTPEGPVGSGVEVEGSPSIEHSPEGAVWARDAHRVYRLGDTGDELARSKSFSDVDALLPVSAEQAWIVSRDGFVRLLSMKGSALVVTASDPTNLRAPVARAWDAHGVWFVSDEETRLHRLRLGPEGLSLTLVLEGVGLGDVRPISGTERFWIASTPRSYVQAPASEVRRVEVGFEGGAVLERGAEGAVQMTGTPEAGAALSSLEVDWPGLARAKGLESGLRIEVRDENAHLVGQGLRRFVEPEGLLFQWTEPPGSTEHLYDLQVSSLEVENGSRLTATFRHVPFGVPLLDQVWVRTALACVALTLLLLLPLVLLRPSAAPRRWLPLLGYGVSLVGAGGSEVLGLLSGLRIHLPTVVGVVSAEVVLCACLGLLSPAVFRKLVFTHPFSWAAAPLLRSPAFRRRFFATHVRQVRRRVDVASAQANGEVFVDLSAHVVEYAGPGVPPSPPSAPPRSCACCSRTSAPTCSSNAREAGARAPCCASSCGCRWSASSRSPPRPCPSSSTPRRRTWRARRRRRCRTWACRRSCATRCSSRGTSSSCWTASPSRGWSPRRCAATWSVRWGCMRPCSCRPDPTRRTAWRCPTRCAGWRWSPSDWTRRGSRVSRPRTRTRRDSPRCSPAPCNASAGGVGGMAPTCRCWCAWRCASEAGAWTASSISTAPCSRDCSSAIRTTRPPRRCSRSRRRCAWTAIGSTAAGSSSSGTVRTSTSCGGCWTRGCWCPRTRGRARCPRTCASSMTRCRATSRPGRCMRAGHHRRGGTACGAPRASRASRESSRT
ncbi:hypothetical protein ACN28S_60765 [Cystobacter fuscus]